MFPLVTCSRSIIATPGQACSRGGVGWNPFSRPVAREGNSGPACILSPPPNLLLLASVGKGYPWSQNLGPPSPPPHRLNQAWHSLHRGRYALAALLEDFLVIRGQRIHFSATPAANSAIFFFFFCLNAFHVIQWNYHSTDYAATWNWYFCSITVKKSFYLSVKHKFSSGTKFASNKG